MFGDSGGPYWTYRDAVPALEITTERLYQCRMSATKITDDILKWIKMISGIE